MVQNNDLTKSAQAVISDLRSKLKDPFIANFGRWEAFRRMNHSGSTFFGLSDGFGDTVFEFEGDPRNDQLTESLDFIDSVSPEAIETLLKYIDFLEGKN